MSHEYHQLVTGILCCMAEENGKTFARIKRLLFIKENRAVNRQFWEILDAVLPEHPFSYVGCCAECGSFELR